MAGLFASIAAELGRAVNDIRHKVVEEGWFGKQVTDTMGDRLPMAEKTGWDVPRTSFDAQWAPAEKDAAKAPEPEIHGPDLER